MDGVSAHVGHIAYSYAIGSLALMQHSGKQCGGMNVYNCSVGRKRGTIVVATEGILLRLSGSNCERSADT